jgi:hypothetical protein
MSGSQPVAALFAGTVRLARAVVLSIRRLTKAFAAAILCIAFTWVGVGAAQAAPAAPCPFNGYRYAAVATSGAGTNKGTGAWQNTWGSWSFNGHPKGDNPFSNEAVWVIQQNNNSNSLEVGWNVGEGANSSVYQNYMYPYYTYNNGGTEKDYTGTVLPQNSTIWDSATSDGTSSWAYVNNKFLAKISYGVATPREDVEQTEVDYHDIWMGGGSGSSMSMSYQNSSNQWNNWGFINGSTSEFNSSGVKGPAGHGYYIKIAQPASATQGGYGDTVGC